MTKQLTFKQSITNRRRVECNERPTCSRRRVVNRVGEQGFACARLSEKHNWHVRFRGQRGQLQTTRHRLIACRQVFDSQSREWLLHCDSKNYCFRLSRNWRIGSNAYSINVRPPTMICACPLIPTRKGKACPARAEIS